MTFQCVIAGAFIGLLSGVVMVSDVESSDSTLAVQRARIVQLEEQVRQIQRMNQACQGELVKALGPQLDKERDERLASAARDMGCKDGADWNANPPVCK